MHVSLYLICSSFFYLSTIFLLVCETFAGTEAKTYKFMQKYIWDQSLGQLEVLINRLQWLMAESNVANSKNLSQLVDYKFYTELILKLCNSNRQYGIDIKDALGELKVALGRERRFEQNIKGQKWGAIAQFTAMMFLGLSFLWVAQITIDMSVPPLFILLLIMWQLAGMAIFFWIFKIIAQKFFYDFERYVFAFYHFQILWDAGLPISKIVVACELSKLNKIGEFKFFHHRLEELIAIAVAKGHFSTQDVKNLIADLWQYHDEMLIKFKLKLVSIKFIFMAFVFFPAFLSIIFAFLSSMEL